MYCPSQVSAPEYVPLTESAVMSGIVPVSVAVQEGVGSPAGLAGNVAVQVSGAGKAIVNARTLLKAEISGAGLVEYAGNPRLEQEVSGIGKIRRR